MSSPDPEPLIITKRALDVTPYEHGIWCSIEDGEPFVNPIERRSWSEDGEKIWFLLGTHNFVSAAPDEEMRVVEYTSPATEPYLAKWLAEDAERMAKRPRVNVCPTCGHRTTETRT